MKRIALLTMVFTFALVFNVWAQRTVSGKVTDDTGEGLPGVNVVIKGTTTGVVSDFDGNYQITVPNDQTVLVFSSIGMTTQEIEVGVQSTIDVSFVTDTKQLAEVIVTAQGIQRKKESLGFAVSTLSDDAVADKTEGDVVRSLRSKASGVQITQQSGVSGSGTNVIIRGYQSFTGNNQPLFIVDGVPFNTNTNSSDGGDGVFHEGANNGSSRFLDLDPNNIKEISILKGLAAATLYGSQGRNGVVLITTKTGGGVGGASNKKMSVQVTQSVFANQIASIPDYQDKFSNGFNQVFGWYFSNWGASFTRDGLAGWASDNTVQEKDGKPFLPHPYSMYSSANLRAAFPEYQRTASDADAVYIVDTNPARYGAPYEFKQYDNVKNFFRTGLVSTTSVNANGSSKDGNSSFSLNFGYLSDQGFTPGNELDRVSFSVGGRSKLTNGLELNGTMNLTRTNYIAPPIAPSQGSGAFNPSGGVAVSSSVFGHIFFTPRSVDIVNLPYEHPLTKASVYYRGGNDIQHPLWTVNNAFNSQSTDRIFGNIGALYKINDHLNLSYRLGYDLYTEGNSSGQHKGGNEGALNGYYRTFDNKNTIWDHTFSVNGNYDLGSDIVLNFNVGSQLRRNDYKSQGVTSTNQLLFGTFRHFNFNQQSYVQRTEERNLIGIYGQADVDFKGYLFLTLAGRYDKISNFDKYNSLFYPSVSAAFVVTELFPSITSTNGLNFFKLRLGYGTSAGFRSGYPTANVLVSNPRAFIHPVTGAVVSSISTSRTLGNPNLKPEQQAEFEIGFEGRFWKNKVNLEFSWYNRNTRDLIVNRPLDPSTGFGATYSNIGRIVTKGVELDLGVDIFSETAVKWNVRGNFTSYGSIVKELGEGVENIIIDGFSNLGNFAVKGQPLGIIKGTKAARTRDGQRIVGNNGFYVEQSEISKIGNPTPDFVLNITNTVSYKNFTLTGVINYQQGGDIYSMTVSTLIGRGLTTDTEDRLNTFILPGVKNIGTAANPKYVPNDIQINNSEYYFNNILYGPEELQIYDATTIRLQEISLSYNVPSKLLTKTPFGRISIIASGFNLWYATPSIPKGTNFDPNVAGLGVGNGQGFDYLNGPSSRRFGGTIKLTF